MATSTISLSFGPEGDTLSTLERALPRIKEAVKNLPGVIGARAAIQRGTLFGRPESCS